MCRSRTTTLPKDTDKRSALTSSGTPRAQERLVGGGHPGLEGRLSAHCHRSFRQEMAGFLHRRPNVQIQEPAVRTLHSSQKLHPDSEVVAEHLRRKGVYVFVYLDDWLLTAPTAGVLRRNILITKRLVHSLGFIINEEKSAPEPTQRTQFLGALLDFKAGRAFPTQERVQAVTECAKLITREQTPAARHWMRLLGLIASLTAILPLCRLRMRIIQLHVLSKYRSHKHPLSRRIPVTNRVKKAVIWWTQPANIQPGRQFSPPSTSSILTTDASKTGWGAHWKNIHLSGTWSPSLAKHHINLLELWAIHIALRRIRKHLSGQSVLVKCDMSVVMYLNKMGGVWSRALFLQTVRLLLWYNRHLISIQAAHLP